MTTEETLIHPFERWDDPVRAAMLRVSGGHNLDPDAVKEPIQPMFGKEGLADAYKMWNRWGHGGCDRVTFAHNHQSFGFYWSNAFPDTIRLQFSSKLVYNDPLAPGRKHRLEITGQFIGRHDLSHLLRGRDDGADNSTEPGVEEST